ncbi:vanadium-dependent haloperoxidase [Mucilaginibacter sp. 21P]|uniref:vanadium-dependent haloperoxidase n=1 Tax=Mucilaginibacter sp. 21P TaxID=2778902 RepID=UPI001C55F424|nr:vanadium-dependent haloperoxidase [Mucilaginibacter sp. 21P]QXV64264.1 vanadium-dependent haloperoxidase [Mucilaginibacter sp. 21P]
MKKFYPIIFIIAISLGACHSRNSAKLSNKDVSKVIEQMTDVMIHDVTNPPLAARFYAYTCLAGYEVVNENDKAVPSMHGKLNGYPLIQKPKRISGYDYRLAAVLAMLKTAQKLQPSGTTILVKYEQTVLDSCKKVGFSSEAIDSSASYAQRISKQILAYAKADKYNRISNYKRYQESAGDGDWKATPPAYMNPVEPYFNTIRPFTLDSASQFLPVPPIPFSTNKSSQFYKYLQMSYAKSGKGLTDEEQAVANFWDCNPFAVQNDGHMLIGLKKISPGAHWMGIAGLACEMKKFDFEKTLEVYTMIAIGLTDSFICCWDDKYRTNRIRPETAIRKYIDPNWKPLLQTPPFPEYISGHSVVSTSSAVILTHYFGDNFHFTDNVERKYGIPPRKFSSFKQAAREAAISRYWGGIHFMDAIDNGTIQGNQVGMWVLRKIKG